MKVRYHIIALTAIVGIICFYNLSFSWYVGKFRRQAEVSSTGPGGAVDSREKADTSIRCGTK